MSAPPPFVTRFSALEAPCEWRLVEDGLQLRTLGESPGLPDLVPWEFVTQVRLRDSSSGSRPLRVCELTLRNGRVLRVPSSSYESFATFRDDDRPFREFLQALHAELARRTPECRFVAGDDTGWRWFNALMLLVGLAGLAFIVWLGFQSADGIAWSRVIALGLLLLVAVAQFGANRPRPYSLTQLPEEYAKDFTRSREGTKG